MNARDIEIAVAEYFGYRMNIIVPNIRWGLFSHLMEADLLIVRPSGWATEIEIKVSTSDIKRDHKKRRHLFANDSGVYNDTNMIQRKYFAVPMALIEDKNIPESVGIIGVADNGITQTIRTASINRQARKLTTEEIRQVMRLGCMRIWTLKEALNKKEKSDTKAKP